MKSHFKKVTFLFLWFFVGCATVNFANLDRKYPMPSNGITVDENKILHHGKVFAELKFYFPAKLSESLGEAYLFNAETQYRGLAIYYHNNKELVWIFPKEGRQDDLDRGHFVGHDQTDGYIGWVNGVKISDDARSLYYKTPGLISQSSYVYSVEHAVSKLLDRDWHL